MHVTKHYAGSQRGFTLVEIVVTVAMTALVTLIAVQLLTYGMQSSAAAEGLMDLTQLKSELQTRFQNEVTCRRSFTNNDTAPQTLANLQVLNDAVHPFKTALDIYQVLPPPAGGQPKMLVKDQPTRYGHLIVDRVEFDSVSHSPGPVASQFIFHGTINLFAQRATNGAGTKQIYGSFPIVFVTSKAGTSYVILSCRGAAAGNGAPQTLPACTPRNFLAYDSQAARWVCRSIL